MTYNLLFWVLPQYYSAMFTFKIRGVESLSAILGDFSLIRVTVFSWGHIPISFGLLLFPLDSGPGLWYLGWTELMEGMCCQVPPIAEERGRQRPGTGSPFSPVVVGGPIVEVSFLCPLIYLVDWIILEKQACVCGN